MDTIPSFTPRKKMFAVIIFCDAPLSLNHTWPPFFFFFGILYSFICNTWSPEYKHVVHVLQVIFSCAGLNKAEPYLCTLDSSVEITPSFMVMYVAAQLFSVLALYSLWEGIFPSSLHLDTVRTPGILRWVKCQKCFYIRDHWYLSYWCLIIYYRLVGLLTWLFL